LKYKVLFITLYFKALFTVQKKNKARLMGLAGVRLQVIETGLCQNLPVEEFLINTYLKSKQ